MPETSNSSGSSPESAQSSLLRLTRRHSLPASTTFSTFLTLWSAENQNREHTENDDTSTVNNKYYHHRSASISSDTLLTGNGNGSGSACLGENRHRYGHRQTRTAIIVDTPVIVKSYNPGPAASRNMSPQHEDEVSENLVLPPIDSFSFDGVLKAVDPTVAATTGAVGKLCDEYQASLRTEVDVLMDMQVEIDTMMKEADKLTNQALKATKTRTERLDAEAVGLKEGSTVDALAEATEATHTTLTSIITTLLAIDEMLLMHERLSSPASAHKMHYPKLHTLLADKAYEIKVRFRNVRSPQLRPVSRPLSVQTLISRLELEPGESSSSRTVGDTSMWSPRRLSTSSTLLLSSPTVSRSGTYSHHRCLSSPHLQLRTILPSPSNDPHQLISTSGSYFPIAPRTATGICLTSPIYSAQQHLSGSSTPRLEHSIIPQILLRRSSGMWSQGASSGALAAFVACDNDNSTNSAIHATPSSGGSTSPASSKPPGRWRHSAGSWAGFFGRKSSQGSNEAAKRVSAEERLKMLLQAAGDGEVPKKSKGKGKGVQR